MAVRTSDFLRLRVRPCGLLTAAGIVATCATLFGFLGRFSWFLDLFSHFRVQYMAALSLIGLVLLATRRWRPAAIFLVFACINLLVVAPLYFGRRSVPPGATVALRVMLINVNTQRGDPELVKETVRQKDPDILVLEEISAAWVKNLRSLTNSHPYSCIRPREDNFGIGLFSKFPIKEHKIEYIGNPEVPSIVSTVDTGSGKIRVIAAHPVPPIGWLRASWRNGQLDELAAYCRSDLPVIVLGDLNVTPWNYHLRRLLNRRGLIDSSQGRGVLPTWPSHNPLMLIPLDYCLHSPDLFVVDRRTGPHVGSDHYPVIVDLAMAPRAD